ncbi:hypothetical protein [Aeromonas caviae]|uniref:hypothetical protein n=1 Tax=Aeromonas caviae TaxID=648 RepID=UPI0029DA231D|nr:hypothetical protein [Aeromonas caviae]MDX7784801.1 hypothetical protein [Aeromonas caviae]
MNFTFTVFSRRWGHTDTYEFEHNSSGWYVSNIAIRGQSTPAGKPYLYRNFDQDYIKYPSGLGDMLEYLWEQIRDGEITEVDAQNRLQELADWVSTTERSTPKWPEYN